jgi:hypothetical protein
MLGTTYDCSAARATRFKTSAPGEVGPRRGRVLEGQQQRLVEAGVVGRPSGAQLQLALALAAAHRQVTVRVLRQLQRLDRLLVVEVLVELAGRLRGCGLARVQEAAPEEARAHELAQLGLLGQALGQDVGGALDRGRRVGVALVGVPEREGPQLQRLARLRRLGAVRAVPDPVRELLQPGLARLRRAAGLLLLVGKVEVLERVGVERLEDLLAQLGVSFFCRSIASTTKACRATTGRSAASRRSPRGSGPRPGCRSAPCGSAR